LVGEDNIIDAVKEGKIDFDRLICHEDSLAKLTKAGLGRILGPRQMMPSAKTGTVVKDIASTIRDMAGGSEYREKLGVIRLAIGAINFTPEMLQKNIRTFMDQIKTDMAGLSEKINKELHEVVLSSTNSPGFSLSGELKSKDGIASQELVKAIPS
jgi:large subunit ribosomal protein L1